MLDTIDSSSAVDTPYGYPRWQAAVRTEYRAGERLSVATLLRYVDDIDFQDIDGYLQANVNARFQVADAWLLSFGARNLLDDRTLEYPSELFDVLPTEIERSYYLNLRFAF